MQHKSCLRHLKCWPLHCSYQCLTLGVSLHPLVSQSKHDLLFMDQKQNLHFLCCRVYISFIDFDFDLILSLSQQANNVMWQQKSLMQRCIKARPDWWWCQAGYKEHSDGKPDRLQILNRTNYTLFLYDLFLSLLIGIQPKESQKETLATEFHFILQVIYSTAGKSAKTHSSVV